MAIGNKRRGKKQKKIFFFIKKRIKEKKNGLDYKNKISNQKKKKNKF